MSRGHVYKRGSTWTIVYEVGRVDCRRKQKSEGGFRTRSAAKARLTEVLATQAAGTYVEPTRLTMGEFLLTQWLPSLQTSGRLKPTTLGSYESLLRDHVVPRIGHLPLRNLAATHLNALYAELLSGGRADGRGGLSATTVRLIHRVINTALADAVKWSLLARNVAVAADPPKREKREMRVWSRTELGGFLGAVRGHPMYPLFRLAAMTGMRRGEIAGLRWDAVDLDSAPPQVTVRRNRTTVRYQVHETAPKTASAHRRIALDPDTVNALRSLRRQQIESRLQRGQSGPFLYVFTNPEGEPLHPESISGAFAREVTKLHKATGLPVIRFHDLRHTHATVGLEAGVAVKVMADRLGHAGVAITLDTYSHVLPSMQADATDRIAALVSEIPPPAVGS